MQTTYQTDKQPMQLNITILCSGTKKFRVWCEELGKKNSKYADRVIVVEKSRTIYFSLPVTPEKMFIGCLNAINVKDDDFEVIIKKEPIKKYNVYLDSETKQFVEMAEIFSQVCGYEMPAKKGTTYSTSNGKFNIKYFQQITDFQTGQVINTPARIGHSTGRIEVSFAKFCQYTIPMRMMILLHEYSHKYRNPKIGLKISNEFGADVNGLYIYLGLGFSKIDAICVFSKVFLRAQTDGNIQRIRKIQEYIKKFENQEYAELK